MKIVNTKLEDKTLVITLDGSTLVNKIYLDSISNKANRFSMEDKDHTKVIELGLSKSEITVEDLEEGAYIVTVIASQTDYAIAIDFKALYYGKVNLLTTFCNTCLDAELKWKIILCDYKWNLMDYALENSLWDDVIEYYENICRLLNMSSTEYKPCSKCANGICPLI